MPNSNKKKKKSGKDKTERSAALALRAERNLPIEELPPFPGEETFEQEMNRMLDYKHVYSKDCPMIIEKTVFNGEDVLRVQQCSNDMKPLDVQLSSRISSSNDKSYPKDFPKACC